MKYWFLFLCAAVHHSACGQDNPAVAPPRHSQQLPMDDIHINIICENAANYAASAALARNKGESFKQYMSDFDYMAYSYPQLEKERNRATRVAQIVYGGRLYNMFGARVSIRDLCHDRPEEFE